METVYALAGIALIQGTAALAVACYAWRAHSRSSLLRRMRSLEADFAAQSGTLDDVLARWKALNSREGMRELREARAEAREAGLARPRARQIHPPSSSKAAQRAALGCPDNPVEAVLANLGGRIARAPSGEQGATRPTRRN